MLVPVFALIIYRSASAYTKQQKGKKAVSKTDSLKLSQWAAVVAALDFVGALPLLITKKFAG
ncbi:hypothetical protein SD77_2742 [Bacillus badius]|uniref:Uncharacterized protein n=1 Tax=Bacillus badius TaxID=1455 RepID=A0ABR5APL5_BACBA|nr:hypothetical protein SD77_2742 [Bacillus badius]